MMEGSQEAYRVRLLRERPERAQAIEETYKRLQVLLHEAMAALPANERGTRGWAWGESATQAIDAARLAVSNFISEERDIATP
ncbi:MAG: hypothetical protein ACRDIV_17885 [Ktedonobacteraceae bacterium]